MTPVKFMSLRSGGPYDRQKGKGTRRLSRLATNIGWQLAPRYMIGTAYPKADPALEDVYLGRGLILIHIPKNAGTSVEDAIYNYRVRHRTWRDIRDSCPRAWASLPKIAILRDPVDRFLSAFDYLKSGGRNEADRRFAARVIAQRSIEEFVDRFASRAGFRHTAMRYFHFRPQSDFICDAEQVMVEHMIPFPKMADGLVKFAGVAPGALAHANRTTGHRTRKSDLSPDTLDVMTRFYAQDAALFAQACQDWEATEAVEARSET
ncbi:sulfotransferase family 2 domain-containing protein [uncultured Roseobacter sp.]|uniref:sulfotransferase family 2 domain-containing protein n=1 Tax=uncultured Roseobacter sp. TaxID=114847 RepID=UPI0026116F5F|nr:sulfotransferase family 2 domain-containing protein [uncultured Roseobacter sp.]